MPKAWTNACTTYAIRACECTDVTLGTRIYTQIQNTYNTDINACIYNTKVNTHKYM